MKWINANDELPEAEDTVLLYMPEAEGEQVWPGYFDAYRDGIWLLLDGMPAPPVTHWMHLPLPPVRA